MSVSGAMQPREGHAPVGDTELFYRDVGEGLPIVVLHGGPDFDHTYLLPDLDQLADGYRLIYYDQRGRGRSGDALHLERLDIEQYIADLDRLIAHLALDRVALLGHSWGGHLAMQYAVHRPARVSHLVLMNTAPASNDDWQRVCAERTRKRGPIDDLLAALASTVAFANGDPDIVARYYRLDYASGFARSDRAHRLVLRFQSRDDVLRGRSIENRLMQGLFWSSGYTLLPALRQLCVPTLVLHGDCDFVPVVCAQRIAAAIPGARLAVIERCGHFAYIEAPGDVHAAIDDFFGQT